jgi:hypothetical protein
MIDGKETGVPLNQLPTVIPASYLNLGSDQGQQVLTL